MGRLIAVSLSLTSTVALKERCVKLPSRSSKRDRGSGGRTSDGGLNERLPIKIHGLWRDIKTLVAMLIDMLAGRYRAMPLKTIAALVIAILYIVSPIDLLPDFIPLVGYLDDAFIFILTVDLVRDDLNAYRAWKEAGDQSL